MDLLHKLAEIESTGIFGLVTMLVCGILLLVLLFVPSLRKTLGRLLFSERSEVESVGNVIRAISGLVILILLLVWVLFGDQVTGA
jgi:hypothetical protein